MLKIKLSAIKKTIKKKIFYLIDDLKAYAMIAGAVVILLVSSVLAFIIIHIYEPIKEKYDKLFRK